MEHSGLVIGSSHWTLPIPLCTLTHMFLPFDIGRTYSEPRKWMRGKGRVTIQFGCCYNYAVVCMTLYVLIRFDLEEAYFGIPYFINLRTNHIFDDMQLFTSTWTKHLVQHSTSL